MAHYCMSDLHGEAARFDAMLAKIGFCAADTLYILGDVVDRGPDGIALLRAIMAAKNITMLLGNHEYMLLRAFAPDATETDWRRWNRNGNAPTLAAFLAEDAAQRETVLAFLRALPTHRTVCVGERRFYLVHGFPGANVHDAVWGRPRIDTPNPVPDCRLVIGHTPVPELARSEAEQAAYDARLSLPGARVRICHAPGFLDLDCCCGYDLPQKALACLRLEDMAEFYV